MMEEIIRKIIREELAESNKNTQEVAKGEHKPFAVYMGEGVVLTRSFNDIMYEVSSYDCTMIPHLILHGVYESEITKYFLNNVKEDSVFLDIGANFGYYTCLVSKKIDAGKGGKVYSFEPNRNAFELLQKNIMLNWINSSGVFLNNFALSDSEGEVSFKNYKYRFGGSQFYTEDESSDAINTMEVVKVSTKTLDSYLGESSKVDFMKIDVEGAEFKVLKGAEKTIDRSNDVKIVLEWSISQFKGHGIAPESFVEFFKNKGFKPYGLKWQDGSATEVTYEFLLSTEEHICGILFQR